MSLKVKPDVQRLHLYQVVPREFFHLNFLKQVSAQTLRSCLLLNQLSGPWKKGQRSIVMRPKMISCYGPRGTYLVTAYLRSWLRSLNKPSASRNSLGPSRAVRAGSRLSNDSSKAPSRIPGCCGVHPALGPNRPIGQ